MRLEVSTIQMGPNPTHLVLAGERTVAVVDQADRLVMIPGFLLTEDLRMGLVGEPLTALIDLSSVMTNASTRMVSFSDERGKIWVTVEDEMIPL